MYRVSGFRFQSFKFLVSEFLVSEFQVSTNLIPPSRDTACRVRNIHDAIFYFGGHGMPCPYKLMLPSVIRHLYSVICHLYSAICPHQLTT